MRIHGAIMQRTIIIENGKVVETDNVTNDEWKKGLLMEEYLHEEMCKICCTGNYLRGAILSYKWYHRRKRVYKS